MAESKIVQIWRDRKAMASTPQRPRGDCEKARVPHPLRDPDFAPDHTHHALPVARPLLPYSKQLSPSDTTPY